MERRDFIKKTVAAGVSLSLSSAISFGKSSKKLNVLVMGGTYFVGPSVVNAAINGGHKVTLFNRGITNPNLFKELDLIKGDREKGKKAYAPLKKQQWDVIIDVWPQKSRLVDEATDELKNNTKHYIFISSIAVYNDFQKVGLSEEYKLVNLEIDEDDWGYPEEKLAAEFFIKERFKNNHTILRGGPIKGWRDPAIDILYWCIKLNRDKEIIAPGSGLDHLQFIDVKDIGRIAIQTAEKGLKGTYNCTGPGKKPLLWRDFLEGAKKRFNSETKLIWASEEFLSQNEVVPFSDLPLWTPLTEDAFMQISNEKLVQTGFEFTPFEKTLEDCMKWFRMTMSQNIEFGKEPFELGLERKKELRLIDKIKS